MLILFHLILQQDVTNYCALVSSLIRSFLSWPMNAALSAAVWKRPWPNLEDVSMNLSLIFSSAFLFVWTSRDCRGENKIKTSTRLHFTRCVAINATSVLSLNNICIFRILLALVKSSPAAFMWLHINNNKISFYLAQCNNSLLGAHNTSLQHHIIIVDLAIMREASHRCDCLLCEIIFCWCIVPHNLKQRNKTHCTQATDMTALKEISFLLAVVVQNISYLLSYYDLLSFSVLFLDDVFHMFIF